MNSFLKVPLTFLENVCYTLLPGTRYFVEKYISNPYWFGASHKDYSQNQYKVFKSNISKYINIKGKTLLELGPGGSVGFGKLGLDDGLKEYYALDNGDHAGREANKYGNTIKIFNIDQDQMYPLKDQSVDIIYSCAVLEHVHNLDLCFREMTRVLKRGGVMNHQVDLRDHLFNQKSLWFLTVPEFVFRLLCGQTGVYVNRRRYSYYLNLIKLNGLEILEIGNIIEYKGRMDKKLSDKYTKEDLRTLSFNIVLRKK